MALQLAGLRYKRSCLGNYEAVALLTRFYKGNPRGEFKYTFYRYRFNDANLYDELTSDDTPKGRRIELLRFIRNNAQHVMRHNDDEYKIVER